MGTSIRIHSNAQGRFSCLAPYNCASKRTTAEAMTELK